jgi:hypothetical protein
MLTRYKTVVAIALVAVCTGGCAIERETAARLERNRMVHEWYQGMSTDELSARAGASTSALLSASGPVRGSSGSRVPVVVVLDR